MDKEDVKYMHISTMYYSAMRRRVILLFATTWMTLEYIMLNEISHTKTDIAWYYTYGILKKKKSNS